MKKLVLNIPKPCHEDWNKMTPEAKGRFCGSCQKTVVDFSNMSDAQLAQFFKKPPASVCGRLHPDQLERHIDLPRKKIPWVRYFFQFTWPAFVLFLKGCTNKKEQIMGVMLPSIENSSKQKGIDTHATLTTLGFVVPEPPPVVGMLMGDTVAVEKIEIVQSPPVQGVVETALAKVDAPPVVVEEPKIAKLETTAIKTEVEDSAWLNKKRMMDTVNVVSLAASSCGQMMMMGGIGWQVVKVKKEKAPPRIEQVKAEAKIYPNPALKGTEISVEFTGDERLTHLRLFSASGQMVAYRSVQKNKAGVLRFTIPAQLSSGIYILQLVGEKGPLQSERVVVQ